MRRIPVLLCVAGLAAAPASVAAGPSKVPSSSDSAQSVEKFEWSTSRGRLGVMVMSLTPELRKYFGVPQDRGVLVARVEPGSPAAAAGVAVGDVIVEVRGHKIDTAFDVLSAIAEVGKGEHAQIGLVRDRASRSFDATLADDAAATAWPGTWLRDFAPFHEPSWFRDMSRPPREAPKPQTGTPKTSKPA